MSSHSGKNAQPGDGSRRESSEQEERSSSGESLLAVVERVWMEEGSGGFCLSAQDIQLARKWQQSRAPSRVIERALRNAFKRWGQKDSPRSLRFADREVSAAIEQHLKTHANHQPKSVEPEVPGDDILRETLTKMGKNAEDPRTVESLRAGYRVLLSMEGSPHTVWGVVRDTVFTALERRLRPNERANLARLLLECDDKRMSDAARKRQQEATRERFFAEQFELKPLLKLPSTLAF